jgi:hypothetical protein
MIKKSLKNIKRLSNRLLLKRVNWYNLRQTKPVSKVFGLDRGTSVGRFYIEKFLTENKDHIRGTILEVGESTYAEKFGHHIEKIEVINIEPASGVTLIADLTRLETIPESIVDCFICTQTLNFIYDVRHAISGCFKVLKKNGVILATVSGISKISRYDMERWGDYWRFTVLSSKRLFSEAFGSENVETDFYGNVLSSVAAIEGISAQELTEEELTVKDNDYQMLITIKARKA